MQYAYNGIENAPEDSITINNEINGIWCFREDALELLQRYRRDRRVLLDFILSGSLIKKVIMPPGAITLDDVDLDQVSVDYVLGCAKKGNACILFGILSFDYFRITIY